MGAAGSVPAIEVAMMTMMKGVEEIRMPLGVQIDQGC